MEMVSSQVFRGCGFKAFGRAFRAHARECYTHRLRSAAAQCGTGRYVEIGSSEVFRSCEFKVFGLALRVRQQLSAH